MTAQLLRHFVAKTLALISCFCIASVAQQSAHDPRVLEQKFDFPTPIQWKLATLIPGNPYFEVSLTGVILGPANSQDLISKAAGEQIRGKIEPFADRPYAIGLHLRATLRKPISTSAASGLVQVKNASGSVEYPPQLTPAGFVSPAILPAGALDLHWSANSDTAEVWDFFPVPSDQKEFLFRVIPPPSSSGSAEISFRVRVQDNGFDVVKTSPDNGAVTPQFTAHYGGTLGANARLWFELGVVGTELSGFAPFAYGDKTAFFKGKVDSLGNFELKEYFPENHLVGLLDGKFSENWQQMSGYYSKPDGSGLEPFELEQVNPPAEGIGLSTPPCPTADAPAGWKTYVNDKYRFCFSYPPNYTPIAEPWLEKYTHDLERSRNLREAAEEGRESEWQNTQYPDSDLCVGVSTETWDLQAMVKYAPTGQISPPEPRIIAGQVFYYYGPGGGGVCYPDGFFYDLRGKPLSITFEGPCADDKTPTAATKKIEDQILATFQTY
jgi:hypothetical protein